MKFWTQRSFPTLVRTTAQGAIISVARFGAAAFVFVAPVVIGVSPNLFYVILAILMTAGLVVAWAIFRTRDSHDEFAREADNCTTVDERSQIAPGGGSVL